MELAKSTLHIADDDAEIQRHIQQYAISTMHARPLSGTEDTLVRRGQRDATTDFLGREEGAP